MLGKLPKKIKIFATIGLQIVLNTAAVLVTEKNVQSFSFNQLSDENSKLPNQQLLSSNTGRFKLGFDSDTKYKDLQYLLQESGLFHTVVNDLNQLNLNLPVEIPIIFSDCGEANAFFIPSKDLVLMCYELFNDIYTQLSNIYSTEEDIVFNSITTGIFILYHEVGHALTDVLKIPVTGREEDAVDDFASILLLKSNNSLEDQIVLNASNYFRTFGGSYQGQHSFGEQRFYNIICLLYGRDPQKYSELPELSNLGKRAARCENEYQQKLSSWESLLAPHSLHDTPRNNVPNSRDGIKW